VDLCERMTDDKGAGNKLKREGCREEGRACRFWPSDLYEIEMTPQGRKDKLDLEMSTAFL